MGNRGRKTILKILSVVWMVMLLVMGRGVMVSAESGMDRGSDEADVDAAGAGNPANPVHHCTKENDGSDYTDWSYVYFGSYPQSEVTGSALTSAITGASYDANGDAWVNGTKYRRISKSDTNNTDYFGDSEYRYFKWERIKWRVLKVDDSTMFVMADKGLDCKCYNDRYTSITWGNCKLRNWLNNNFYGTAFSNGEQGAIVSQMVVNEDNPYYNIAGGNNTWDKVYLLSLSEAINPNYGFCANDSTFSMSRRVQPNDYAHARGASTAADTSHVGACWWLRSLGSTVKLAASVYNSGSIARGGFAASYNQDSCVPVLHINLSSAFWQTSDDGTSGAGGIDPIIPEVSSPTPHTVKAGTSATFSVTASGGNPSTYTYQWYYVTSQSGTGTKINGATSSSYTITSSDLTAALNGRYYYCVVNNGIYDVPSDRAKLTVYSAPSVTSPTAKTVQVGTSATFSVTASGGYPTDYTYQWYYATSQGGTGARISGATSSSYQITSGNMTAALDGRYYYCIVSNGQYDVTSSRAKLTVETVPSIITSPTAKAVKEGTSVTFSVGISGSGSSYTYQWYYATSQSGAGTRISGATSFSYTINAINVIPNLNGRYYYCIVSSGQYSATSGRAKLTVYSAPSVTAPTAQSIKVGESVTFSVTASGGNPTSFTYQWYYATSQTGAGRKISGATASSYTIDKNVTTELDGRYYYCTVSNGQYSVSSDRARLTVEESISTPSESDAPGQTPGTGGSGTNNNTGESGTSNNNIPSAPIPQRIEASSYTKEYGSKSFYIQASTSGNGTLTYQSGNQKVAQVSSDGRVKLKGYGTTTITIQASQTPTYQAATKQITIEVIPKKVKLKKVQSPGSRRISLKWKKDKKVIGYEIYMSPNKNFKSRTIRRTYPKSKTNVALIGLQSKKTYYVKIRSYAKVGKKKCYGEWSKTKSVKIK